MDAAATAETAVVAATEVMMFPFMGRKLLVASAAMAAMLVSAEQRVKKEKM